MEINQITQMIIEYTPVITALIGILVSVVIGIKRIKNNNARTYNDIRQSNDRTVNELKNANEQLKKANEQLINDNAELKDANDRLREDMQTLLLEMHNVHIKQRHKK